MSTNITMCRKLELIWRQTLPKSELEHLIHARSFGFDDNYGYAQVSIEHFYLQGKLDAIKTLIEARLKLTILSIDIRG